MNRRNLTRQVCIQLLKLMLSPVLLLFWIVKKSIQYGIRRHREREEERLLEELEAFHQEEVVDNELEQEIQNINSEPELPEMCQVFPVGPDTVLGIQYVSMCPDESAHVRIIGDTTFSQLYKRKVYYEKTGNHDRYITVSGEKFYLDPRKTRPIDPVQAKEGK